MLATVVADIAEFERGLIRERVRSDLPTAKAQCKRLGRRPEADDRRAVLGVIE
jgi:DNA invertase Pin-like site-specific DNA recombinase